MWVPSLRNHADVTCKTLLPHVADMYWLFYDLSNVGALPLLRCIPNVYVTPRTSSVFFSSQNSLHCGGPITQNSDRFADTFDIYKTNFHRSNKIQSCIWNRVLSRFIYLYLYVFLKCYKYMVNWYTIMYS